jgi:hypothetical protein
MELKRQMGFASYGTAWTWLHKIRKAMVARDRKPLAQRVEAQGDRIWDGGLPAEVIWAVGGTAGLEARCHGGVGGCFCSA